ncbi:DUF488 family protein [Roseovarius dicentrarchi]|uniref:DUF488 domain-containing protein n=1 Tax=Roseovarius dicentrarchi TaxID=2250573 RepID=UPI000DEADE11|nr:DUF488 domain-containing protein [Roseovarius dicentrarchi]
MKIFTIGFTKSTAKDFFGRLNTAGVKHVYDTRLNRTSQLSGFAKQKDLDFFLSQIGGINYSVDALLAPTADILSAFRKNEIGWGEYERRYLELLSSRRVEQHFDMDQMHEGCLLCSEATPEHCHRRLAANYLAQARTDVEIVHL